MKQNIISLGNKKIKVYKVEIKGQQANIIQKEEYDFTDQDIKAVLAQTSKRFKSKKFRILLPEQKTYIKLIELPAKPLPTRQQVLEAIKTSLPEPIEDSFIDWKIINTNDVNKDKIIVQVFAASPAFLKPFMIAAQSVGLKFSAFEPPSFALARLTQAEPAPHLINYKNDILTVAHQGRVFTSLNITNLKTDLKKITDYVKKNWNLDVKKTITQKIDPIIALAIKPDIKGKDEKVLNLNPKVLVPTAKKPSKKIALMIFILTFIVVSIATYYFFFQKTSISPPVDSDPSPTPTSQPTATPTPLAVNSEELKVQILNGSGVAGAAGKAAQILEELGYQDIDTGNASSYDYDSTQIATDKSEIFDLLTKDLSGEYSLEEDQKKIDQDSEFDVIVTIGKS